MYLKRKKLSILFSFFMIALLLYNLEPLSSNAATADRIWGQDRYKTASSIAVSGWQKSTYAILVTGDNYPDALAATPLSKKYDAPILLTERNKLTSDTLNTLKLLKVSNVFIVGGTGVVSTNVYSTIVSNGMKVHRIAGANRYETSIEVAKYLGVNEGIFVVDGSHFGDALAVGPIAANLGMPIILTDKKNLDPKVEIYLKANKAKKSYVMGNSSIISEVVVNKLPNVERIDGNDIYERNRAVLKRFRNVLEFTNAYIATGTNFPDALAGGALASKYSSPLILTAANPTEHTLGSIKDNKISKLTILGGEGVVSTTAISKLLAKAAETVDYTNIPKNTVITGRFSDENFKKEIYAIIGKNIWEPILYSDVKSIAALDVAGRNIKSLDGIEYFKALESLRCYDNQITSIDIRSNTALTVLAIGSNQLTRLDVSNNPNLIMLDCWNNELSSLNIDNNPKLISLVCSSNELTSLDVSNCKELASLYCHNNNLTELNISKNAALSTLYCGKNRLTTLNISKNTALTELACYNNQLVELDTSRNIVLNKLFCTGNQLKELDVSMNTILTVLDCGDNKMTALDVSKNRALIELGCSYNLLTELDLSKNTSLKLLSCHFNQIKMLYCYTDMLDPGSSYREQCIDSTRTTTTKDLVITIKN